MAAFSFTLFSPTFLSPRYRFISPKTRHSHRHHHIPFKLLAITPNRKYYLNTFDDDGIERFQQILCQATRDGKLLHQDFKRKRGVLTGRVKSKFWNPSTQQDSREVKAGDLFVCCVGSSFDARRHLTEAHRRGAVSVIASKGNGIEETSGYKTLVIVEDANSVLATLAASFYGYPSKSMTVIAINGTNGKTTTTYLLLWRLLPVDTKFLPEQPPPSSSPSTHHFQQLPASSPSTHQLQQLLALPGDPTPCCHAEASRSQLPCPRYYPIVSHHHSSVTHRGPFL
ncbi:hypothetical protein F3Y22_tig00111806pilonHSYRG00008 [Hibiscus syriacus]|uniref:Uncharacterized protein n=1 Tax=Hibiscus syriacus TaxID=106335 RepID=A0A6A2XTL2_HIBSY|nr:hypothetical protein F3Y22_tig00111806pilonHSYRG00008 [Hibiscus syriacus]